MPRATNWLKNLVFAGLCLVGVAAIARGLRPAPELLDEVTEPKAPDASVQAVAKQIDAEFEKHWAASELKPAGQAPNSLIARRLALGLTGAIPSLEEIRAIQRRSEDEQIDWWIERLLQDRRYSDYIAERFARGFVGTENGPFIVFRRRRFVTWLSDRFEENVPYDQLIASLISDEGIWTSSPSVNFLTVTLTDESEGKPDAIRLAGRTSRAFLGMRIDCLQCHDDRLGNVDLSEGDVARDGLQEDFHQLAAFFSEARVSALGITDGEDKYNYTYLNAEKETEVDPVPPFRADLLPDDGNRRQQLAAWVTHAENKPFARAAVNRVWALMFGKPLVEPIDDIPLNGEYPPGFELLAEDFAANGFDIQRLIRIIAATRVFQLNSEADHEITIAHELNWAAFPLTRLRPEQVAGAVIQSASVRTIDADSHIIFQLAKFGQTNDFVNRYGDTGEDEFEERAGTIAQRLLMMNGNLVKERTKPDFGNSTSRIGTLAPNDDKAVEVAFLCALSRMPSEEELKHFSARLEGIRGDSRASRLEDIFWSLLNSTEFSWNH